MRKKKSLSGIKKLLHSVLLFTLAVFMFNLATSSYVRADDQIGFEVGKTWGENQKELEKTYKKAKTVSKNKESKGGVQLKIKEYPLSHYEAVANTSGMSPANDSLLGLSNAIFWFDKALVQGFDTGIQILQGTDFLQSQLRLVGGYTKTIWTQLLDSLLPTMLLILVGFVLYAGFVQQSLLSVLKQFISFIAVLSLGTVFIMNGPDVMILVNDASLALEQTIISSGSTITGNYEMSSEETSKDTITSIMRNKIFDVGVMRPYLFMNYGTSNVSQIEGGQKTIDSILKYSQNATGKAAKKKEVQKQAKDNLYMDKDGAGVAPKLGYALFSIYSTFKIGSVILVIAGIGFVSQIVTIIAFFLLVLSLFLSLIPKFQGSWIKPLSAAIGAIFLKGLSVFFVLLLYVIIRAVDVAMVPDTLGKYICNVFILGFVLSWIKDNRGQIVSAIINKDGGGLNMLINGSENMNPAKDARRFTRNRVADYMLLARMAKRSGKGKYQSGSDDGQTSKRTRDTNKLEKNVRNPNGKKPSGSRKNTPNTKGTEGKNRNNNSKNQNLKKKNQQNGNGKKTDTTPQQKKAKNQGKPGSGARKNSNPATKKTNNGTKKNPSSLRNAPENKVPKERGKDGTNKKSPSRNKVERKNKKPQEPKWSYPNGKAPTGHSPNRSVEEKKSSKKTPEVKHRNGSDPSKSRK